MPWYCQQCFLLKKIVWNHTHVELYDRCSPLLPMVTRPFPLCAKVLCQRNDLHSLINFIRQCSCTFQRCSLQLCGMSNPYIKYLVLCVRGEGFLRTAGIRALNYFGWYNPVKLWFCCHVILITIPVQEIWLATYREAKFSKITPRSFLNRGFDDTLTEFVVSDGGCCDGDIYEVGRKICILQFWWGEVREMKVQHEERAL